MGFNFKTSAQAGEFLESVYQKVHARNRGVLARSALFFALGQGLPERFKSMDSNGIEFQESTVVGDELAPVIRAAINFQCGETIEETKYRRIFKALIDYGSMRLKELWEESNGEQSQFISLLLEESSFEPEPSDPSSKAIAQKIVNNPVSLTILNEADSWVINSAGGNGITVISGQPGTGKSQLALDLLAQVARQGVRFLFFDLKGELEHNPENPQQIENRKKFLEDTGANYTCLIDSQLPINPLYKGSTPTEDAQISTELASLVRSFAPQLSASQERVIRDAFDEVDHPDFAKLIQELDSQNVSGEGFSILEKIVRFNLFANCENAVPISEWLLQSQIIDFKPLGTDNNTKVLAVAFILNYIMKKLNQALPVINDVQPLQMILFIDEAHLLLPKEGKSGLLGQLARQGRSWGFPVWLASQDADKFVTSGEQATNFADLASCGIHFSPQLLTDKEQKNILGRTLSKQLNQGEAVLKLGNETTIGTPRQYWKNRGR